MNNATSSKLSNGRWTGVAATVLAVCLQEQTEANVFHETALNGYTREETDEAIDALLDAGELHPSLIDGTANGMGHLATLRRVLPG